MPIAEIIFSLVGGLALFLYGIYLLSTGLQKIAGEKLEKLLRKLTGTPLKGVATGATVTAIIQSSSITTVTLIGFLNAGLLSLRQAMGVILGAEIGTTITAQVVAFKIGLYALPILALGFLFFTLGKQKKCRYLGEAVLGLGLLFLGMIFMKEGVSPLGNSDCFVDLLANFSQIPVFGVLTGAIFTGIIQSSSATTALVIAMGTEGVVGLEAAIPLILGANIGTCVTVLLASIGATRQAKRSALFHFIFNVTGVTIFLCILPIFINIISGTSSDLPRQIANAHTLFNVTNTLIMLPFVGLLAALLEKIIPGKEPKIDRGVKYIDAHFLSTPSLALAQARKEEIRASEIVLGMFDDAAKIFFKGEAKLIDHIFKKEEAIDEIYNQVTEYLMRISERNLSKRDSKRLASLTHSITDIERMADHINNLAEIAEAKAKRKISFSSVATQELSDFFNEVRLMINRVTAVLEKEEETLAKKIINQEDEIDKIAERLEKNHLGRLDEGICSPQAGVLYVDILRNLERIGDHSNNIAYAIIDGF